MHGCMGRYGREVDHDECERIVSCHLAPVVMVIGMMRGDTGLKWVHGNKLRDLVFANDSTLLDSAWRANNIFHLVFSGGLCRASPGYY